MLEWLKFGLSVVLITLTGTTQGRQRPFFGRIVSESGLGIAGVVESKDHTYRFTTNTNGTFYFKAEPDSIDYFVFSAPNFDPKEFLVEDLPDDSIIIELPKHKNVLADATIGGKGKNSKTAVSGIDHGGAATGCYLNIYDEIAIYLPADKGLHGMIGEIGAYIMRDGVPTSDFKMHIYAKDSATGTPGDELTDSVLVMHARHGGEWVTADLTGKYIQAHEGVFVSVEWINGTTNDFYPLAIPTSSPNYYAGNDSLRQAFNGQVIGLDWQEARPTVFRRYSSNFYAHKDEGRWYATPPLRGGHRARGWITPMIYFTYNYIQR